MTSAAKIRQLQARVKELSADKERLEIDLRNLRQWWQYTFTRVLKIHGEGNAIEGNWLVTEFAKAFRNSKTYWGW